MDVLFRTQGVFRFGPFRLDPVGRILTRDGEPVPLQARLFDTLQYLAEHHERVVERDELMQAVWRGRIVDANNLGQAISGLRKALRDGADGMHWVATAQRGYRIAVPVAFEPFEQPPAPDVAEATAPASRRARRPWIVGAGSAAGVLLVVGLWLGTAPRTPPPVAAPFLPPPRSVAVLAFTNMTGDPAQNYLADGMAEELIDTLSQVRALQVAARSSSFVFKSRPAAIADIARELNVSAVLEGSIRGGGGRLRIVVRLVDGRTGFELWGKSFDRAPGEALAVETEVGALVAKALHETLLPEDVGEMALGGTADAAAFDAYLRGIVAERSAHAHEAVAAYDAALARDPLFARALARRAIALSTIAAYDVDRGGVAARDATEREAIESARRAIAIAPDLGIAHAALGSVLLECRMDFRGAAVALAQAEDLAPGDADVVREAARLQAYLGHWDAVFAAAQRRLARDPLSPGAYRALAEVYLNRAVWPMARDALRHALQLESTPTLSDTQMQAALDFLRGDYEAVRRDVAGDVAWHQQVWLAVAEHALGHLTQATAALHKLQAIGGDGMAMQYATIYAQWGQPEAALHWLDEAYRLHDPGLVEIRMDRLLDPIRSTPEYRDLEVKMGMPP
jgi:TolB-like protein/DNA-binding winged helix-turn-helix (wHTH) protein